MKLVRYGRSGQEKPDSSMPTASSAPSRRVVKDITPDALTPGRAQAPAGCENGAAGGRTGKPRLGCPLAGIGKMVGIGLELHGPRRGGRHGPCQGTDRLHQGAQRGVRPRRRHRSGPAAASSSTTSCELAAVIGRNARNVDEGKALGHVVAYGIVNDVSERAFQMEHGGTTTKGKSADTFGPIGPGW